MFKEQNADYDFWHAIVLEELSYRHEAVLNLEKVISLKPGHGKAIKRLTRLRQEYGISQLAVRVSDRRVP